MMEAALKYRKIHLAEDLLHRVVDGGDLLDGGLAGQLEPYVSANGPNRAGPLVLQEGLQQVVGVLRQVFEDGVLEGLASVVGESGVEVGGRGGVVVGGSGQ